MGALRCGKYSCESQPVERLRIDHATTVQIVKLLAKGLDVRSTARVCDCRPGDGPKRPANGWAGCERLHDPLTRNVKIDALQIDELWAKVGCFQKNAPKWDDEKGDQYTFTYTLAAREKFIVSFHTGKRDNQNTDVFVHDVANRVEGRIQITTDAFKPYPDAIRHYLLQRLDYSVMVKHFSAPPS